MTAHDIIVIGGSAGGIEALTRLVRTLPATLPAAIFVVVHIPADFPSLLPDILSRHGRLPASHARNGQAVVHGRIFVAPPDHHLLLEGSTMCLTHGPKENYARPAIDPLFRTAAETYGERVVGVVLSGALSDGTAGLITIKRHGGITIVQEPGEAGFSSMPQSAIRQDHPDYILPLLAIAAKLQHLTLSIRSDVQEEEYDVVPR